ncbi:glycosyltransferase [Nonlabens marinus]|uniref:Glycosyl transferase, group 1 n=1 Tax=Nonlabens marinus S1-08 TaxID=1454201 RepID=W8VVU2_9FLAO|nr:glycosyltransferase [Nonlabens marinus]BAO55753.1 glycosyl transferase, group 1 [Nonlabens marinus S1-08]
MKLLIVSDAPILYRNDMKMAYAPYVKEMDLWMRHVSQTTFLCPATYNRNLLITPFENQEFNHVKVRRLEFHRVAAAVLSLLSIPFQIYRLYSEMKKADHVHLRAPGNLALLAGFVALSLSRKRKTIKYAGNWDPSAKQPLSYRLQKKLFSSPKWSENTSVMAYGQWSGQSGNIKPFFTATYSKVERKVYSKTLQTPFQFLFVGTLSKNKNPYLLIELVKELNRKGIRSEAHFYGDGPMRQELIRYCQPAPVEGLSENNNNVSSSCHPEPVEGAVENSSASNEDIDYNKSQFYFHGNQPAGIVKKAYEGAHFVFLASQSEGWPKVIAEAMWHGCLPIATPVSCVPWMLNQNREENKKVNWETDRGILFYSMEQTVSEIKIMMAHSVYYEHMSQKAQQWSQQYTLEKFDEAIKNLLHN